MTRDKVEGRAEVIEKEKGLEASGLYIPEDLADQEPMMTRWILDSFHGTAPGILSLRYARRHAPSNPKEHDCRGSLLLI